MSTAVSTAWYADAIKVITSGIRNIAENLQQISEVYVTAIDRDPAFREHLADELPAVPGGFWRDLERVGRGQLDSRIAGGGVPYSQRLRRLTMSEQKQAIEHPLQLLTSGGDTLRASIDSLLPEQAEQVFARDHIRSLPEQKAWIEAKIAEQTNNKRVKYAKEPVEIDKKRRCIIVGGIRITAADLADYLKRLNE